MKILSKCTFLSLCTLIIDSLKIFLSLVPVKATFKNNDTAYKLKVRWTGPELLLVNHAQLILLIDGERVILNPSKTYSQHLIDTQITSDNNDIYERVDYDIEKELIEKIASAKKSGMCAIYATWASGKILR